VEASATDAAAVTTAAATATAVTTAAAAATASKRQCRRHQANGCDCQQCDHRFS
jgi:hypothetical protein